MEFQNYLKNSIQPIEDQLNIALKDWSEDVSKTTPKLVPLIDEFIAACQGGKRLRGALVKLGYELAGGTPTDEIYKPAAAFEIFQTAILAHDDIIDQSPTRRGRPTLYHTLGGDHYGVSQTICLGDVGFFIAFGLISDSKFPDDYKNRAVKAFSVLMLETASGEMLDVMLPTLKTAKTEQDILTIFRLKTARYTITGPLQLGAILAGADQYQLDKIASFGDNLGIAFQIQDDILGVFGEEGTIGKSTTSDIEEGKITLLYLHTLQNSDSEGQELLSKHYGQGSIGTKELTAIRELITETGSLDYSNQLASQYVEQAIKLIPDLTSDALLRQLLTEMAYLLIKRDK